jgi:hypothetical protein
VDGNFYQEIDPIRSLDGSLREQQYRAAPSDWLLAVGDIENSTGAVEGGRHVDVNFVAAAMIASLSNLCGVIPFQFGGDGAVALIPPGQAVVARRELARTRGFAARELNLTFRVGLVPLTEIATRGAQILVGRYEPTPGNSYAHFLGDGIDLAERSIKGRGDESLAKLAAIDVAHDDGDSPDLTGLSCRWSAVKAVRGRMVALVTKGADNGELHAALIRLAGLESLRAGSPASFEVHWPPKRLMLEVRARRGAQPFTWALTKVLVGSLLAYLVFRLGVKVGGFDPARYRREMVSNLIDFSRSGDTLSLVFDCPADRIEGIRRYLEERAGQGELNFGMHVADFAVMTCLVGSAIEGRHIHFADGGDGGYTRAAIELKAREAMRRSRDER